MHGPCGGSRNYMKMADVRLETASEKGGLDSFEVRQKSYVICAFIRIGFPSGLVPGRNFVPLSTSSSRLL